MKRFVWAAVVGAGLLGGSVFAQEAATGTPKIEFDRVIYDFGKTSQVSKLEGVFIISNTGDAPLEKIQARASCGCTSAPLKTDKLMPGEKTELAFTLNISPMNRGRMDKHITVTSNDPKQPSVNLTLRTEIVPIYDFNPMNINVGDLRLGNSTNITVTVKRTDGKPLDITKAEGTAPMVQASLNPVEGSADSATIQVTITGDGAARRFNDSLRVIADNPGQPVMVIPINGRFVGDLVLTQDMLFWGVADRENWPGPAGETATTRKVVVSSNLADQKLELSELTSTVPELKVEFRPVAEGRSYELVATLDKLPKESTTGVIKFATNLKSQPHAEVRVTINILKRS